jgi:hypothetical protein
MSVRGRPVAEGLEVRRPHEGDIRGSVPWPSRSTPRVLQQAQDRLREEASCPRDPVSPPRNPRPSALTAPAVRRRCLGAVGGVARGSIDPQPLTEHVLARPLEGFCLPPEAELAYKRPSRKPMVIPLTPACSPAAQASPWVGEATGRRALRRHPVARRGRPTGVFLVQSSS